MSKTIRLDILRRVANDSISIYDALKRAHTLTEESKRILSMAEDLLCLAGLAYAPVIPASKTTPTSNASSAREEMVSAYIAIRQSYADLGDALYQLAKAHLAAKARDKARIIMEALLKIDPEYRDVANMLRQSLLDQAKVLFGQGKWDEGRAILKRRPGDKELRLAYLSSFLDDNTMFIMDRVCALQREEPRIIELPSYQPLLASEAALMEATPYPHRTVPYSPSPQEIIAENIFYNSFVALRAELSSIV